MHVEVGLIGYILLCYFEQKRHDASESHFGFYEAKSNVKNFGQGLGTRPRLPRQPLSEMQHNSATVCALVVTLHSMCPLANDYCSHNAHAANCMMKVFPLFYVAVIYICNRATDKPHNDLKQSYNLNVTFTI